MPKPFSLAAVDASSSEKEEVKIADILLIKFCSDC